MSEAIVHFVGRRQPPLEATLTTDGTADPLPAAATVTFSMRENLTNTLKVAAAAAVVVSEPNNTVRYEFAGADVDTEGWYLGWWTVTAAGQTVDTPEFVIEIRAHDVGEKAYLELEEAKSTLEIEAGHADTDIQRTLVAASRMIDEITQTRFYTTAADEVRYYSPDAGHLLFTDEISTLTELATDAAGGTTFGTVWTANTDYVLQPENATVGAVQYRPWDRILRHPKSAKQFPCYPRSVRVTGKFGWTAVPDAVKVATGIIATKALRRARSAPMGIVTAFDGTAVRMSRFDPQVEEMLAPYNRSTPYA